MKRLFCLSLAFIFPSLSLAQAKLGLAADLVSRYVWRGLDFGQSATIQPTLKVNAGNLEVGAWGSYALSKESQTSNEIDLYAGYSFALGDAGTLSVGVTDYYFPLSATSEGVTDNDFFDYGAEGNHVIEPSLGYTGPASFPIAVKGYMNVANEADKSKYVNVSYPFTVGDLSLTAGVGAVLGKSAWYATDGGLQDLSLSASKAIKVTEAFSLPLKATFVINPNLKQSFLVIGFSL